MKPTPKRVHIVGSSGSGKTTVAGILSEKLQLPHYDLDDVRYPPSTNKKTSYEERIPKVSEIASADKWLVEGIYVNSWVRELLEKADLIIWLDTPLRVSLYRVSKRYLKRKLTGKDRYGFKSFLKLIRFIIHYQYPSPKYDLSDEDKHITKKKTQTALEQFIDKVVLIKGKKELRELLDQFENGL